MDRRKFLGMLVGGVAVAAAAQSFPFKVFSFPSEIKVATIAEYSDYYSFSQFSLAQAIDESVSRMAATMSYRLGRSLDKQILQVYAS